MNSQFEITPPLQNILTIPLSSGRAMVPFPMNQEDYDLLLATLALWKSNLIKKPLTVTEFEKRFCDAAAPV